MDLSVVIIARAKEDRLRQVLASVDWIKDKVVVIDSSEEIQCPTEEICKSYKARNFFRKLDNYSNQKNFAISKAESSWILSLDSDETVSEELGKEIESSLRETSFSGYYIPRKNLIGEKWLKYGGLFPDYSLRLFRKGLGKFVGEVHEKVQLSGETGRLVEPLVHYTYSNLKDYSEKVRFYSSKEAEMDFKSGARVRIKDYLKIPLKFFKLLIFNRGFLDGYYGFASASLLAYYSWLKLGKMRSLAKSK